jgi:hypothetical protein
VVVAVIFMPMVDVSGDHIVDVIAVGNGTFKLHP